MSDSTMHVTNFELNFVEHADNSDDDVSNDTVLVILRGRDIK